MKPTVLKPRTGILAGGNWIVDQVKLIDVYPQVETLANISAVETGTGGAPYNVLLGLAQSGASFPLLAAGLVGDDEAGRGILANCRARGIDTRLLQTTNKAPTSYTDVMTEQGSGRRTFFHARGANALWDGADLDFTKPKARIFHLGYLLLLDALDRPDRKFGTRAGRLLAAAQAAGLKTSIDVVSEDSQRFVSVVAPALPHVNYCILNEIEAGRTAGVQIRDAEGGLDRAAVVRAAHALLRRGVKDLVVIHFPEGAFACDHDGNETWQPSLKLPERFIAGSAGAGDAFCAGVLLGLHEGWELPRTLLTGVCLAAASLSAASCTAGIKSLRSSLALAKKHGVRQDPAA